jgi:hypothetical protein
MPVKNRIFFIFSLYRFLDDFTQWVGTSLWGVTLPNIDSVLIWRQDFARTRQLTFSPCFSQARMEEKSREFARRETRFTRIDANALLVAPKETEAEAERRPATYHSSPNI